MKTIEQQVEEFRKDFNYAHFTWNGDNATGEMFAKKSRNKVVNAFKKALQERDRIAREEERERIIKLINSYSRVRETMGNDMYNSALRDIVKALTKD